MDVEKLSGVTGFLWGATCHSTQGFKPGSNSSEINMTFKIENVNLNVEYFLHTLILGFLNLNFSV